MRMVIDNEIQLILARKAELAAASRLEDRFSALSHEIDATTQRIEDHEIADDSPPEARQHHEEAVALLEKGRSLYEQAQRRRALAHPSSRKRTCTLLMDCEGQLRIANEALERAVIFGADSGPGFKP